MNALIYADEYQFLERHLDAIQFQMALHETRGSSIRVCSQALDVERGDVIRRLMQLDDLIAFDGNLAS